MRHVFACLVAASLALAACSDSTDIDTERDTLSDPLGDIAWIDDVIYATNHDDSGNAGSQVDLFAFSAADPAGLLSAVPMNLNGQGYLAMTTDGRNLYLQPRDRAIVIKVTPQGRRLWLRQDLERADDAWRGRGICFDLAAEELVALYTQDDHWFVVRRYRDDFTTVRSTSAPIRWDVLAPGTTPRAVDCVAGEFYVLGTDTLGNDVVVTTGPAFDTIGLVRQVGPGAVGLTLRAGQLWIAYEDRRLVPWRD